MPKQFSATNFPETIFVTREDDGDDDSVLFASGDPSDLVTPGCAVVAAEYRLVRAGVVIATEVVVR